MNRRVAAREVLRLACSSLPRRLPTDHVTVADGPTAALDSQHRITASGRRQLEAEMAEYRRTASAIGLLLDEA